MGVPPLGCMPRLKLLKGVGHGSCVEEASSIARLHNKLLPIALQNLAIQLNGFKYAFADVNTLLLQRIQNPSKYGNCFLFANSFIFSSFLLYESEIWTMLFLRRSRNVS